MEDDRVTGRRPPHLVPAGLVVGAEGRLDQPEVLLPRPHVEPGDLVGGELGRPDLGELGALLLILLPLHPLHILVLVVDFTTYSLLLRKTIEIRYLF